MSEIFLVRHGQASFRQENYDVLSHVGIAQAKLLAAQFLTMDLRFDALYSGPLERQKDTAVHFADEYRKQGIPVPDVSIIDDLTEYDTRTVIARYLPGIVENDPSLALDMEEMFADYASFRKIFERSVIAWVNDPDCRGIESWRNFCARIAESLDGIKTERGPGRKIVVFTSGGVIAASMKIVLGLGDERAMRLGWEIVNTSVTRFKYSNRGIGLVSFNSSAHLECAGNPELITYK
jgi:broad specificity phosphatase PhoE